MPLEKGSGKYELYSNSCSLEFSFDDSQMCHHWGIQKPLPLNWTNNGFALISSCYIGLHVPSPRKGLPISPLLCFDSVSSAENHLFLLLKLVRMVLERVLWSVLFPLAQLLGMIYLDGLASAIFNLFLTNASLFCSISLSWKMTGTNHVNLNSVI